MSLPEVTSNHIARAKTMIDCGLDVEQVSQWLATHEADKAELKRLRASQLTTDDGVVVKRGDVIWVFADDGTLVPMSAWWDLGRPCYSTREAAEKAKP